MWMPPHDTSIVAVDFVTQNVVLPPPRSYTEQWKEGR
jgi:hypothetical protein